MAVLRTCSGNTPPQVCAYRLGWVYPPAGRVAQGVRFFPVVGWAERGGYNADGHGNSVPRFHITWGTGPGLLEPFVRRVRVEVGPPVEPRRRTGPLAVAELADAVRDAIQRIVDEASPPSWLVPG